MRALIAIVVAAIAVTGGLALDAEDTLSSVTALPSRQTKDGSTVQPLPSASLSRAGDRAKIKAVLNLAGQSVSGVLNFVGDVPPKNWYDPANNQVPSAGFGNSGASANNRMIVANAVEFGYRRVASFPSGTTWILDINTDVDPSGRIKVAFVSDGPNGWGATKVILTSSAFSTGSGYYVLQNSYTGAVTPTRLGNTATLDFAASGATSTTKAYEIQLCSTECCGGDCCNIATGLFLTSATVCRLSAGDCDAPEVCTGSDADCPVEAYAPRGTVCRLAADKCDAPEYCPGNSKDCPVDGFASRNTICRLPVGDCDVPEFCSGNDATCPTDGFASSNTVCRPAVGVCDAPEFCSGSAATCPDDRPAPSTTMCRNPAGVCDAPEYCTGTTISCPDDSFAPRSIVCRLASDRCDAAEKCTGDRAACPADTKAADGTACDRLVLFPPRQYNSYSNRYTDGHSDDDYYDRDAQLQAGSTTAQATASIAATISGDNEYLGSLVGSYGRVPRKEWYKRCQGTCQAGVCTLSPYKPDKCFDY